MDSLTTFTPAQLMAAALVLIAIACVLIGAHMMTRLRAQSRTVAVVDRTLAARGPAQPDAKEPANPLSSLAQGTDALGKRLGSGSLAESLLPAEDNKLLELAGYPNIGIARARYVVLRFGLAILLPLTAVVVRVTWFGAASWFAIVTTLVLGFAIGYLLPKWLLTRRVKARKEQAGKELSLFIDLLRLLQGVGLSVDQSLQVIIKDFASVLPVLSHEFSAACAIYARGRTREQSFARLIQDFGNDDIAAICRLIEQVDRHGGAVQEPLNRFSQRIRDKRRFELKERIGRLTVKMTGVMIVTLMPALLIVTGGMGFLAVIRGLSRMAGGN
ncbi:type II secretion system F family protein [Bordetella sp. 15P40C-2]|uniref:type II secretion system F family protein n=1 Tax=Bordetella sp. 15P40C-2 TaxID=2572246 RepID=UPI00132641B2|nr:type II secretion system F family protein [Bordetella sp. 15P40C-2]MVW70571.1 type II secretion system F family protein [Bordetella sp. 15P40C-2]